MFLYWEACEIDVPTRISTSYCRKMAEVRTFVACFLSIPVFGRPHIESEA